MTDTEENPEGDSDKLPDYSDQIEQMVRECYGMRDGDVLTNYVVVVGLQSMRDKTSCVKLIQHPFTPCWGDRGMLEEALDFLRNSTTFLIPIEGVDDDE